ncbi:MAG: hypothetical protein ACI4VJ_02460 [Methanosphaera sp.]|jgi:hypothetical protein|uniref:hypothetical protein n=1 Tax=Methanosphaera sp. TaxID=2666342 RepID=UPI002A7BE90E|nr:hypothetical protein [Methanosphaera sp.]
MTDGKITYSDLKPYESLFTIAPSFLLGTMVKRNTNLVKKFNNVVLSNLEGLSDDEREKLDLILTSDVKDLQAVMLEAYKKTNKKQFKILAKPNATDFIKMNLNELKKLV